MVSLIEEVFEEESTFFLTEKHDHLTNKSFRRNIVNAEAKTTLSFYPSDVPVWDSTT